MMPFQKELTNFESIQKFVDSSKGDFDEVLTNFYYNLGKDLGFEVKKDFPFSFNGTRMPNLSLAWLDNNELFTALEVSFSSKDKVLSSLLKLNSCKSEYSILIFSSKVFLDGLNGLQNILDELKSIKSDFLLIDISKEDFLFISKNQPKGLI